MYSYGKCHTKLGSLLMMILLSLSHQTEIPSLMPSKLPKAGEAKISGKVPKATKAPKSPSKKSKSYKACVEGEECETSRIGTGDVVIEDEGGVSLVYQQGSNNGGKVDLSSDASVPRTVSAAFSALTLLGAIIVA